MENERPKTAQEIVNFVALKLREQGHPSVELGAGLCRYRCAYRSSDGDKCAAGWLIPDELMTDELNSRNYAAESIAMVPVWIRLGLDEHVPLIQALQLAHDHGTEGGGDPRWLSYFNTRLAGVCERFSLEYPEPQEAA